MSNEKWIKRILPYYRPYRKLLIFDLSCAFIVAIFDLFFPLFSKIVIDDFIPNKKLDKIVIFSILFFFLYILRSICRFFMGYWGHVMGTRIETDMRHDLYVHLHSLSLNFYNDNKTGKIMSRLVSDLRNTGEMAHHGPENLFISFLMLGGSFIVLIIINVQLTLVMFLVVLIMAIFAVKKRSSMHSSFREVKKRHAEINAQLDNSISGISLCKAFSNEYHEISRFDEVNQEYSESWKVAYKHLGQFGSTTDFFIEILGLIVLGYGGYLYSQNLIDMGEFVAFLLYSNFFMRPIRRLIQFTQEFQQGFVGVQRFLNYMDLEPKIKNRPDAIELKNVNGEIEFHNVSFWYKKDKPKILDNVSFKLEKGQKLALVGLSGVGKTTITSLIPRFYESQEGKITIDGIDILDLTMDSIRKSIGFVQQETIIFWGTIRENIEYGKIGAGEEEIIQAAKYADIYDYIMTLPDKFDSLVGERGVKLSTGQKQRIAIARVFLKNPPILILDEPTSSLDSVTEINIQESIKKLTKERTAIIIAHRLSTIKNVDKIIVIGDKKIKEQGTHKELIEKKGVYSMIYNAQIKDLISE